mgnify:CR=1 FL=1
MVKSCRTIIRENNKLIENFEEKFEKQVLHYKKEYEEQKFEYKEDYVFQYVNHIYSLLYQHINETIITLDINRCTVVEKPILIIQLQELYRLFFEFLEKTEHKNDYWKHLEEQTQDFFEDDFTFIEPKNFLQNYIYEIIIQIKQNFSTVPIPIKKNKEKYIFINETWFEVALEFANGNVYQLIKEGKSQVQMAKTLFKNRKIISSSYRPWLNHSINKTDDTKNVFGRTNSEDELKEVYSYCVKNNINVAEKFITDCNKNGIKLNPL